MLAVVLAVLVSTGCGTQPSDDDGQGGVDLTLLAFPSSVQGWERVLPAFARTPEGAGITVETVTGPSAQLTEQVRRDGPGDLVNLSDYQNILALVHARKVDPDWNSGPTGGRLFGSIITFVVREGNPHGIDDWTDLLKPRVQVVALNPTEAGLGKWSWLAAYAAASDGGRNEQAGRDYLRRLILEHVQIGPSTIAEEIESFAAGLGDVLIIPEYAAPRLAAADPALQIIIPPQTIRVDNGIAVIADSPRREQAESLVRFQFSQEAQRIWAQAGFRPSDPLVAQEFEAEFPEPARLWTIDDLGGWAKLGPQFFDPQNGIVTKLFKQATE
ncbi:hypothetical protein BVC93_05000 [Mycobacterium sp. MS1601]|uniref:extracellular solute-binding protein n=1 Tax=Mycobacterium sp. MS1601 TaxID=1936029 RepID=UPI000979731A|nr:extracellular solute-binding protein [Mycobacterium sp. MS1601]AQA01896.1 hypothetical protein BVC93_05000 [Mycobacterium sp. MS1601]